MSIKQYHSVSQTSLSKFETEASNFDRVNPRLSIQLPSTSQTIYDPNEHQTSTQFYKKVSNNYNFQVSKLYQKNTNCLEIPSYKPKHCRNRSPQLLSATGSLNRLTSAAGSKTNLYGSVYDVVEELNRIRTLSEHSSASRNMKVSSASRSLLVKRLRLKQSILAKKIMRILVPRYVRSRFLF